MRAHMNAGKIGDSEKPMLLRLLQYKYASSSEYMPDLDIISEAMGHMYGDSEIVAAVRILLMASAAFFFFCLCRIAGSDTTTISLSYFFWELSRRADVVRKLQAELDQAMPDPHVIPDISVLQKLPYLNAFIKEGTFGVYFP